jgi:hypothetical protein
MRGHRTPQTQASRNPQVSRSCRSSLRGDGLGLLNAPGWDAALRLMERKVLAVEERSIVVDGTRWHCEGFHAYRPISQSRISRSSRRRSKTESTLLDSHAKSLQYLRLLISDSQVQMLHVSHLAFVEDCVQWTVLIFTVSYLLWLAFRQRQQPASVRLVDGSTVAQPSR